MVVGLYAVFQVSKNAPTTLYVGRKRSEAMRLKQSVSLSTGNYCTSLRCGNSNTLLASGCLSYGSYVLCDPSLLLWMMYVN